MDVVMQWNVPKLVQELVTKRSREADRQTKPDGGLSTKLYSCRDCGTTYISEEMETCSACHGSVEQVPSERDLGL